jgi:hypothetical protein
VPGLVPAPSVAIMVGMVAQPPSSNSTLTHDKTHLNLVLMKRGQCNFTILAFSMNMTIFYFKLQSINGGVQILMFLERGVQMLVCNLMCMGSSCSGLNSHHV